MSPNPLDLSPLVRLLLLGVLLGSGPILLVYLRHRRRGPLGRLHALTVMTLFLTFDLVLFGAFTRLTDSGLGCPDWPGCYGKASPLGAMSSIESAEAAMPTGPVTLGKAWVEMLHRYLAMAVGVLIAALAVSAWLVRSRDTGAGRHDSWWATLTLVWVCIQGGFGALTVTMKLFPAIVTLHLLGGYVLLALLTIQWVRVAIRDGGLSVQTVPVSLRLWASIGLAMLFLQSASGAWVSTNYAVLACSEFPMCQGSWWPMMDFTQGFSIWRPLGLGKDGAPVSFQALTAIHVVHRILAMATLLLLARVVFALYSMDSLRKLAWLLGGVLVLQLATGLSNVVLDWPLFTAVLHTGGAGALVVILVRMLASTTARPLGVASGPIRMGLQA